MEPWNHVVIKTKCTTWNQFINAIAAGTKPHVYPVEHTADKQNAATKPIVTALTIHVKKPAMIAKPIANSTDDITFALSERLQRLES